MWMGIVIHVMINHHTDESFAIIPDPTKTWLADLLTGWIHVFRMPLFFILSGFFAAMLVARNDLKFMLIHRFKRIGLPFLVFWPPLFIGFVVLLMVHQHILQTGTIGLDPSLVQHPEGEESGFHTIHLWFLCYLMWFCLLSIPIHKVMSKVRPSIKAKGMVGFQILATRWWGCVVLTLPLVGIGIFYRDGILSPDGAFLPNWKELGHNGLFFLFGWLFYSCRDKLFQHYQTLVWRYFLMGNVLFVASLFALHAKDQGLLPEWSVNLSIGFVYNISTWLWCFALLGLFLRYFPHHNKVMQYLSNSSYWVYLIHLWGTMGFGILLYHVDLPAIVKIMINIALTTVFAVATYHILVRYSFIGRFLNGHKHTRSSQKFTEAHPVSNPDIKKPKQTGTL